MITCESMLLSSTCSVHIDSSPPNARPLPPVRRASVLMSSDRPFSFRLARISSSTLIGSGSTPYIWAQESPKNQVPSPSTGFCLYKWSRKTNMSTANKNVIFHPTLTNPPIQIPSVCEDGVISVVACLLEVVWTGPGLYHGCLGGEGGRSDPDSMFPVRTALQTNTQTPIR